MTLATVVPRKYTGYDQPAAKHLPGMTAWADCASDFSKLRNVGTWVVRDQRSHPGTPSVHGTGRAVDLSYGGMKAGRAACNQLIAFLIKWNVELGVELILDYYPKPFGRGWRCDRQAWHKYSKPTIGGAPGGEWIHVEINRPMALQADVVRSTWNRLTLGRV